MQTKLQKYNRFDLEVEEVWRRRKIFIPQSCNLRADSGSEILLLMQRLLYSLRGELHSPEGLVLPGMSCQGFRKLWKWHLIVKYSLSHQRITCKNISMLHYSSVLSLHDNDWDSSERNGKFVKIFLWWFLWFSVIA